MTDNHSTESYSLPDKWRSETKADLSAPVNPVVLAGKWSKSEGVSAPKWHNTTKEWYRQPVKLPLSVFNFFCSSLGKTLISFGLLIFAFVAYQLWGTGVEEANAQEDLQTEFEVLLEEAQNQDVEIISDTGESEVLSLSDFSPATIPVNTESLMPAGTAEPNEAFPPPLPDPPPGSSVAVIQIPKIGLEKLVVEGTQRDDLKKGPGHYLGTPMPGQAGNSAIAGHRTTYGSPFFRLNELNAGDDIIVATHQGQFLYRVLQADSSNCPGSPSGAACIISPSQAEVLNNTEVAILTLTTCHPRYSARQRLVIVAELLGDVAPGYVTQAPTESPEAIAERQAELEALSAAAQAEAELANSEGSFVDDPTLGSEVPLTSESAEGSSFEDDGLSVSELREDYVDETVLTEPGDPAARVPAAMYATALFSLWGVIILLTRKYIRRVVWPIFTLPFVFLVWMMFQNIVRLLPANF